MKWISILAFLAYMPFSGCALLSSPDNISAEDLQTLQTQAAQGDAKAQVTLGYMYIQGQGVPQDFGKAREWYEKAAVQGNASAQYNLGRQYGKGFGVPPDYVKAYMWLDLAAARLPPGGAQAQAAHDRDMVVTNLTPAQIAEAQRLTQQCQIRQFKGC